MNTNSRFLSQSALRIHAVTAAIVAAVLAGLVTSSAVWATTLDRVSFSKLPGDRVQKETTTRKEEK